MSDRSGYVSYAAKERPIIFSANMIRAIIDGRKTQTRRVVNGVALDWVRQEIFSLDFVALPENRLCQYGFAGDRLWVRETWRTDVAFDRTKPSDIPHGYRIIYDADDDKNHLGGKVRPSIFMPRWASRISLEIEDIRIEQLQDISEEAAKAEGVEGFYVEDGWYWRDYLLTDQEESVSPMLPSAKASFRSLWESIHGKGAGDTNPWAWVTEFKRV
jgi:hypothetical protein